MSSSSSGTYSRCTALTIFYDEPYELIAAHFSSLSGVVDHVVAVDGAFMLYPEAKPASNPLQVSLIAEICRGLRIGLTLHSPTEIWTGNEVQKRNHSIILAEAVTNPDGWYLSTDCDEIITHVAHDWFSQLKTLSDDGWGAIDIGIRETRVIPGVDVPPDDVHNPIRNVYRALRGLRYGPTHYTLRAPAFEGGNIAQAGICIRGEKNFDPVDSYDGTHLLKFDHRQDRPEYRNIAKRKYYVRREQLGIEKL